MSAIIRYIINMMPYMAITVPIYLIARIVFVKAKKIKSTVQHEIALFVFVVFLVGLASPTIIPKIEFGACGFNFWQYGTHRTNRSPFNIREDNSSYRFLLVIFH